MSKITNEIIDESQTTYIPGRTVHDNTKKHQTNQTTMQGKK
jgi:hypothetical protein